MPDLPNSMHARDRANILHPYTNAVNHQRNGPLIIDKGEGIYVFDDQGKRYIEGLAGLWSVAVGFGEERLVSAAARQMEKLPYYHTFASKSHEPSILLAEKLVSLSPQRLEKVFFTNSGSEANDTVVKLLRYFNNVVGRPQKKKIISRQRAYHGVTVASGSLTGLPLNHRDFDLPMPGVKHVSCPHHYRNGAPGETEEEFAARLAAEMEAVIVSEGPDTVAAFIGEPLMGAGGVIPPPAGYWQKIQEICRKYDVLIVADEVITGFGRLGSMFGCDYYGIDPDIMVVSKQITSSYQPLAAVLISEELFAPIAENTGRIGGFGHGFTGSGHPVATAVALENIEIIEERGLVENARVVGKVLQAKLREFAGHPLVGEVRGVGLIAGVELVADKESRTAFDASLGIGTYVFERAHEHGLIIRNSGDTIAFCPPLIIREDQIHDLITRFSAALDDAMAYIRSNSTPRG